MSKVLFILKRKEDFNAKVDTHIGLTTGLYNSASFTHEMLQGLGIESSLAVVADNNCIDREVTKYRPTHVIVEALWVVPQKFKILQQLHPKVTWIIRLHSEMPFMAGEGIAMEWLGDYAAFSNVVIACNAPRMLREVSLYLQTKNGWSNSQTAKKVIYLPNYYPTDFKKKNFVSSEFVDVGCFGAIRPLKNHLVQAFAALQFAKSLGKKLRFHVNAGRIEMNGQASINNLRGFFEQLYGTGHEMVNHQWAPRDGFLALCSQMDIGMQCNFSETFNIVGADLISQGVPLIGTREIPWQRSGICSPNDSDKMAEALEVAYKYPVLNVEANQSALRSYVAKTAQVWSAQFGDR
jgi:hypothetical protein